MRLRWHPRHTVWLIVTLIVLSVVVGRRMLTERDVQPIGEPDGVPGVVQPPPSDAVVVKDWLPLGEFDGPYRFAGVRVGESAPRHILLELVDEQQDVRREVALAGVTVAPEASAAAISAVETLVAQGLAEAERVRILPLATAQGATTGAPQFAYAARPHDDGAAGEPPAGDAAGGEGATTPRRTDRRSEREPYWLVNREVLHEMVVRFDSRTAADDPPGEEQVLAYAVLAAARPGQRVQ